MSEVSSAPPAPAPPPREPLGASRALLLYVVYFVGQLGGALVIGLAAGMFAALGDGQVPAAATLGAAFVGVATGAWLVVALARRWSPDQARALPALDIGWAAGTLRQLLLAGGAGAALGALAIAFIGWASARTEDPNFGPVLQAAQQPGLAFGLWAAFAVLIAPPIEELLFRGLMLRGFTRSWGPFAAGLCVTALFVASHMLETGGYLPALVPLAALGCATIAARSATNALGPAVALHAGYNGVLMFVVGLARS